MLDESEVKNEAIKIIAALDDSKQINLISKNLKTLTIKDAYVLLKKLSI